MRNKLRYWLHRFILRAFCVRFVSIEGFKTGQSFGVSVLDVPFIFYRDSEPMLTVAIDYECGPYTVRPIHDKEYGRCIHPISKG